SYVGTFPLFLEHSAIETPAEMPRYSSIRIRAEHLKEFRMLAQMLDGSRELPFRDVPIAINEEKVFPGFAFIRPRFDPGHIDPVPPESGQCFVQRAHLVGNAEHQAGAVLARGWTALPAKHQEAGDV